MPTEKQMRAAITAMDRARDKLAPFVGDDERDSVVRLREDLREYADFLERKADHTYAVAELAKRA